MIGKKLKASKGSSRNRVRYLYGSKKHDHEITTIKTIYTNCVTYRPEIGLANGDESDLEAMIEDMDVATKLKIGSEGKRKVPLRPIAHWILSINHDEKLSEKQWKEAIKHWLKKMGFKDTNKVTATYHGDTDNPHVHLAINRICNEPGFPVVSDKDDHQKNMEAVWEMEEMFGLKPALRPEQSWNPTVDARTVIGAQNAGTVPYKHQLMAKIAGCVERTRKRDGDIIDLVRSLRRQNVYVHLRYDVEGQPKGISYEFGDRVTAGSELKKARCTWQKLIGQEGIHYEPSMLPKLKAELQKRNPESKERAEKARDQTFYVNRGWIYMYFVPDNAARGPFIKLKVKKTGSQVRAEIAYKEAMELVEAIMAILRALFGGVTYTAKKGNPKGDGYDEWDRDGGQAFPILHPDQPQDSLDLN